MQLFCKNIFNISKNNNNSATFKKVFCFVGHRFTGVICFGSSQITVNDKLLLVKVCICREKTLNSLSKC